MTENDNKRNGVEGMPIDRIMAALEIDPDRLIISNEFAIVGITAYKTETGRQRLQIEDVRTQQTIDLDALELESLAWALHSDLNKLLDPSQSRWVGDNE